MCRQPWRVVVLLWCLVVSRSSGQRNTDFYSTVSGLSDLIHVETRVKVDLLSYVERIKVLRDSILNFVQDRQPYEDLTSTSAVSEYLKHPVHAFHLIKRMTAGLGAIEAEINNTREFDPLVNIEAMREKRQLPWDEDFTGLATSLVTLQDTYVLDLHELTKGHLHTEIPRNRTIPGRLPLDARDCLNLSQVALHHRFYYRAKKWAEQAIAMAADEEPPTIPKLELDTHHEVVKNKYNEFVSTMKKAEDEPKHKVPVRDPTKHSAEVIEHQNYKRLCRGELLRSPQMDSQLRCRYYKGQDGFFALQPVKLEEVNLKPYIIVMHNVVQDRDIKDMIAFAEPRLQRSMTYTIDKVPSPVRTSSQAWLGDDSAPIANRMNRYLRALVGMGASGSNLDAEPYQLANYGIGGQYLPHNDYLQDALLANTSEYYVHHKAGDRVATLMIYMTDVEEGGATVFPKVGVRLTPRKGDAAFWWNLKSSGEGDKLTQHAGCPVLYGSKWIANKWFRFYSNVFRLPCCTDRNASLAPLV
ncbi:prolyl 4-hydroxylase subunit alpha-1-like [Ixodes scapularis]|uniref:prolyl 4-hydroxylase subunit alpha-1-like n=1 Tax=Ixodes scapularis TaxID=6945 RepID=UPI001A9F09A1|nr:prolyl 4-hydroxylase subunit alpha-1-like [Ixodes scapularis]